MKVRMFRLNKLVRDKILKSNLDMGGKVNYKILNGDKLNKALLKKIVEEAKELEQETELTAGEIADLQEIIDQLIKNYGLSKSEIRAKQVKKRASSGGFIKGHYITTLTLPADNKWVDYYAAEPKRFPEIKD
ncbi:nucleoside triphosphate pyrophosphohydrolase [Candidatus Saccharibacteria bacterium]|nr:nucleoside triphosphate pyrophosphohydrolase [Candidatus Saccharibacteria bacterium]